MTTGSYELIHPNSECQPSSDWYGKTLGASGCHDKCKSLNYDNFLIAPDNNCKCCTDGWKVTGSWLNANIYGSSVTAGKINKQCLWCHFLIY